MESLCIFFFFCVLFKNVYHVIRDPKFIGDNPCGLIVKAMDFGIVVSGSKPSRAITFTLEDFGKTMGSSKRMALTLNNLQKLMSYENKQTKSKFISNLIDV